ncbi:thaumatin [Pyrrhoderma noxium]|uniref:Thaumatin n=1 Tax=Pyrrhoderma noxium TaxID=2282107 RepID=A0A286UV13_9AGAM|nr:thaumatin [Pyrrhoderma noxium]
MFSRVAWIVLPLITLLDEVGARLFIVENNCNYTIWPAIFTNLEVSKVKPSAPTGWELASNTYVTFDVPDGWTSGRIWGRKDCDFSSSSDETSCKSGGCIGGLECDESKGTGIPPVTLAEWTLNGGDDLDYYDVSLVDGFNIPMRILSNKGCDLSDCPTDLDETCPEVLKFGDIGCKSACFANLDGNQQNSPNCCSGNYSTPETCPVTGIQYYDFWKKGCPNAYAFAYDEDSQTALRKCKASLSSDYKLIFCPS